MEFINMNFDVNQNYSMINIKNMRFSQMTNNKYNWTSYTRTNGAYYLLNSTYIVAQYKIRRICLFVVPFWESLVWNWISCVQMTGPSSLFFVRLTRYELWNGNGRSKRIENTSSSILLTFEYTPISKTLNKLFA